MRRAHPVVIVTVALMPAVVLLFTIDPVTPVMVGAVCSIVLWRVAPALPGAVRMRPLVGLVAVSALGAFVVNALYGVPGGDVYWHWGYQHITERSLTLATAQATRALAVGIPAVLLARSLQVSSLAAWLATARVVSPRFALATLIGIRLVPIIVSDVRETVIARGARGVRATPLSVSISVIVVAIRRAIRMSEIAEIRGFDSPERVWSSFEPLRFRDGLVLTATVLAVAISVVVTITSGMWDVLRA
ncbi:MAG: hypothetical protein RIS25_770 [Actinomycetota bacterium]|jgi:energy-coupling factor transport system permease protein